MSLTRLVAGADSSFVFGDSPDARIYRHPTFAPTLANAEQPLAAKENAHKQSEKRPRIRRLCVLELQITRRRPICSTFVERSRWSGTDLADWADNSPSLTNT